MSQSRIEYRRNKLPYGLWRTAAGREVLFNRRYKPIWQRYPGSHPTPADPNEWVQHIVFEAWFYNDSFGFPGMHRAAANALDAWRNNQPPLCINRRFVA